jgi:hypothetical protein
VRRFGFRKVLTYNGVLLGLWICGFAALRSTTPHWLLLLYLLAYGFVRSIEFTSINALGYADLGDRALSKGTSMASVMQRLCNSFGVAVGATALAIVAGSGNMVTAKDFPPVFLIIGLFPFLASMGFLRLEETDGRQLSGLRE